MRNLTIRRNKSFVGCLVSAKIYVEDLMYGDTQINNTPCRKLGELKNGQEQTFQVTEDAVKIYVIADKLSKSFCCEFYQLAPGTEPVFLTGQNRFSLSAGNAFRFDNNDNPEVLATRKKSKKNGIWVLVAAVIIGAAIGFLSGSGIMKGAPEPKVFTSNGMSITLTDAFSPSDYEDFIVCYDSRTMTVMVTAENFDDYPELEDMTTEEYGELAIEVFELDSQLKTDNGLCYFEYDATADQTEFHYTAYIYKDADAFWTIQFATEKVDVEQYRQQIMDYAASVAFAS